MASPIMAAKVDKRAPVWWPVIMSTRSLETRLEPSETTVPKKSDQSIKRMTSQYCLA